MKRVRRGNAIDQVRHLAVRRASGRKGIQASRALINRDLIAEFRIRASASCGRFTSMP